MVVPALLSGGVAIRTDTGDSTSGDRATGVTAASTSSAGAGVGTPLASASAGVFSSVVVGVDAEAEMEAESFGDGGSGRECRFIWLQRGQTQSLDLAIEYQVSATKETERHLWTMLTKRRGACAHWIGFRVRRCPLRPGLSEGRNLGDRLWLGGWPDSAPLIR